MKIDGKVWHKDILDKKMRIEYFCLKTCERGHKIEIQQNT